MHKGYQNQNQSPSTYIRGCQLILTGGQPQEEGSEFSSEDGDLEYTAWLEKYYLQGPCYPDVWQHIDSMDIGVSIPVKSRKGQPWPGHDLQCLPDREACHYGESIGLKLNKIDMFQ